MQAGQSLDVDPRTAVVEVLRAEFAAERDSGFARLRRVPSTQVVRFLDEYDGLGPEDRAEVSEAILDRGSYYFCPPFPVPYRGNPAYERFTAAPWRLAEGLRYTGVTLLAGVARDVRAGGLEGWLATMGFSGRSLRPPEGLVADPAALVPIKPPALRKRVNAALDDLFTPRVIEIGDGIWRYDGTLGDSPLQLMIRYGRNLAEPQLRYDMTIDGIAPSLQRPPFGFESLFGAGHGFWDYLTEENAGRCIALLCELIVDVARISARVRTHRRESLLS